MEYVFVVVGISMCYIAFIVVLLCVSAGNKVVCS